MSADAYLTPGEISAQGLGDVDTVRGWITSGQLPAINAARNPNGKKPRWRVSAEDLAAFLEKRSNRPTSTEPPKQPRRAPRPKTAGKVIKFF